MSQLDFLNDIEYTGYVICPDDPEIEDIIAYLLSQSVLIFGFISISDDSKLNHLNYAVLCNDIFIPSADCEPIDTVKELKEIYHIYVNGGMNSVFEWIKNKRKNR